MTYTVISGAIGLSQNLAASMTIGLILGLIIVVMPLWALITISSEFILALIPGVRPGDARRQLWTLITGINHPYQVVEDGRVAITKPGGILSSIGGPGIVVIKPGNAVVFERAGMTTQIEGPGVARTVLFEKIKQVIDLRPQWGTIEANDVQTRDGIPLHLKAGVGYQIEPLANAVGRLGAGGPVGPFNATIMGAYPVHRNSVFCAAYFAGTSDWQRTSRGAVELALRDAIGRRTLAEIYGQATDGMLGPTIIPQLEREALTDVSAWALAWGVAITTVDITVLEAPAEVRERILKQWEAEAQRGLITAKGEAEARVLDAIETVKLGARDQALKQITAAINRGANILQPAQLERYLELLEQLTTQATKDSATALRYIEALEQLSQNPNARVVLVPPGQSLTITE
jgi:regulator of protease activity HflC (stomatin/prohibitin superfamily)